MDGDRRTNGEMQNEHQRERETEKERHEAISRAKWDRKKRDRESHRCAS